MLEKIHEHIVHDLQQSARTDTIFVITAILFNLVVLAINSAVAGNAVSERASSSDDFVMSIFFLVGIIVNIIAISALMIGRNTRSKLLQGLLTMYRDNEVDKYYDASLLTNYNKRYLFFAIVIIALAITSIAVPLTIRLM